MSLKISKEQAQALAYAVVDYIPEYVKQHESEYKAYLLATGQVDPNYPTDEIEDKNNGK